MEPQKAFVVVSFDQVIGANVPHHHRATAILALRDDAFKLKIIARVILSRHRESSFIFSERWTFRNGPRLKNLMHLEAKVVMQVTRSMFLNNKPAPASLPAASRHHRLRLGSLLEIALVRVWLQSRTTAFRRLHTLLLEIPAQLA